MRTLFAMTLLALPLTASAQAPMPIIPLNPDLSGVWTLDPAPIPRWTTRPRNCVEALYRRTNFAGYGASYVELHKVGEHLEVAGTFDRKRTLVFDYEESSTRRAISARSGRAERSTIAAPPSPPNIGSAATPVGASTTIASRSIFEGRSTPR